MALRNRLHIPSSDTLDPHSAPRNASRCLTSAAATFSCPLLAWAAGTSEAARPDSSWRWSRPSAGMWRDMPAYMCNGMGAMGIGREGTACAPFDGCLVRARVGGGPGTGTGTGIGACV